MKSPQILKIKGFTLIEVVVVMTMISMLGGIGLYFGFDNLRKNSFRSDRDILISALQHARGEAVANICSGICNDGKSHGVKIENDKYIIFQGESFSLADHENDIPLEASLNTTHGGIEEIVFDQLSGEAKSPTLPEPWKIILTNNTDGSTSIITINKEGQILWTN